MASFVPPDVLQNIQTSENVHDLPVLPWLRRELDLQPNARERIVELAQDYFGTPLQDIFSDNSLEQFADSVLHIVQHAPPPDVLPLEPSLRLLADDEEHVPVGSLPAQMSEVPHHKSVPEPGFRLLSDNEEHVPVGSLPAQMSEVPYHKSIPSDFENIGEAGLSRIPAVLSRLATTGNEGSSVWENTPPKISTTSGNAMFRIPETLQHENVPRRMSRLSQQDAKEERNQLINRIHSLEEALSRRMTGQDVGEKGDDDDEEESELAFEDEHDENETNADDDSPANLGHVVLPHKKGTLRRMSTSKILSLRKALLEISREIRNKLAHTHRSPNCEENRVLSFVNRLLQWIDSILNENATNEQENNRHLFMSYLSKLRRLLNKRCTAAQRRAFRGLSKQGKYS